MNIKIQSKAPIKVSALARRNIANEVKRVLVTVPYKILSVSIHFDDLNGPKPGQTLICRVHVDVVGRRDDIDVHGLSSDWLEAFDLAMTQVLKKIDRMTEGEAINDSL